jgi:sigma-E factor negative regulatory protein RseA
MTDSLQPNEALQAQLSAFIDNELPDAECELFTRRLLRDTDLKQSMSRYLLAGEAMRARTPQLSRNFSARIAAVLEEGANTGKNVAANETPAAHLPTSFPRWLKPAGAIAVAASVALFTVTMVRTPQGTSAPMATEALAPVAMTALHVGEPDSYVVPASVDGPTIPLPAARLTNYVVAHSEYTSPLGRRATLTGLLAADSAEQQAPTMQTTSSSSSSSKASSLENAP